LHDVHSATDLMFSEGQIVHYELGTAWTPLIHVVLNDGWSCDDEMSHGQLYPKAGWLLVAEPWMLIAGEGVW